MPYVAKFQSIIWFIAIMNIKTKQLQADLQIAVSS